MMMMIIKLKSLLVFTTDQLKTQVDQGKMLNIASPEGYGITGLQSHIKSPGAQGVITRHITVKCVVLRLRYLLPIDEDPGMVRLSTVLPRCETVGDGPHTG